MRVARVEAIGDAAARLCQRDVLPADRPAAGQRPAVSLAAGVAEIRLGRAQVVPVGLRLHSDPFDRDGLALDAEQPLDQSLRLLVASLAEVVVVDDAVGVDEVERRPVVVVECAPDLVVVVQRDRIVDPALLRRLPHALHVVLERELRRVDSDDDQPVIAIGARPRAYVRLRAQPVDAGERPEVDEHDAAAQIRRAQRAGVEPRARPAERRHVLVSDRAHAATNCWPPSMSYVAPVSAVLVMMWTASAATSAGPTTRPIGSVVRSSSRRASSPSPSSEADSGVSTKPGAMTLTRTGASSSASAAANGGSAAVAAEAMPRSRLIRRPPVPLISSRVPPGLTLLTMLRATSSATTMWPPTASRT